MQTSFIQSPIGALEITGNAEGIASIYFCDDKKIKPTHIHPSLKACAIQLQEYFEGNRKEFDIKLSPEGTEFQQIVWKKLINIPFGKTATYLQISKQIGDANATRAVGNANSKNPVSILIPCHRIIGVNGKLVGYSGGLWRKEWLINHEQSITFGKQEKLF